MRENRQRIIESRFVLAVGDVVLLLLFTAAGRREHHMTVFSPDFLVTALPLVVSWLILGGAFGALSAHRVMSPLKLLGRTTLAWLIACPLAIAIRAAILQRPFSVAFLIVTFGMVWLLFAIWRDILRHLFKRFAKNTESETVP